MTAQLGYGIIGCGWVASAHAWGVRSMREHEVRLVAVADQDEQRAEDLAARFDVPHAYTDYRDLLARDDIQAVSLCLPDFLHSDVTQQAAAAGKHVLCEKPLAMDVAEADAMLAACERNSVQLGLVMNHRYFADNIRTKAAIREGALGRILIGSVLHSSGLTGDPSGTSPWRGQRGKSTGGVLSTQAIHFLDLLLWFSGPVKSVKAWAHRLGTASQDHEDTAAVALQMESGALATVVTTSVSPIMDDFTGTRIEVHGTDGYAMLEGDELRFAETREGYTLPDVELPPVPQGAGEVVFGPGHIHEVRDFIRAIRSGESAPVPGVDGRHLMAVLAAAYKSAQEGGEVRVDVSAGAYSDSHVSHQSPLRA